MCPGPALGLLAIEVRLASPGGPSCILFPEPAATKVAIDILVVAPHPDDAELGMGGAILKFVKQGLQVAIVDLTDGEPTPYGTPAIRAAETAAATEILGVACRINLRLPNRSLQPTLEARGRLAGVIREEKPRWLFAPFWIDAHPDHTAATQLVEDARFWAKLSKTDLPGERHHPERIYNYYAIHLKQTPQPAFVLDISDEFETKLDAIRCYDSQFVQGRPTQPRSFVEQLRNEAAYWGQTIGVQYGEPFASREPLGMRDMNSLL